MDCVNCLVAFTNNPHSLEVALNSIAFLRFCASRLAEGSIGDLPEGVPALEPEKMGATRLVRTARTRVSKRGCRALWGVVAAAGDGVVGS